jgi:hypothetical protein
MQIEVWKSLLRRIPPDQLDNLMVMTAQGTEINVQAVLRMEKDYMVLRGRIAGSNDAGRVFILPYAHLDHMGFQRPLNDAQVQAVFDGAPAAAPPTPAEQASVAPAEPQPQPAEPAPAPAKAAPGLLAQVPTRSKIIQRLRMRTEVRAGGNSAPKQ